MYICAYICPHNHISYLINIVMKFVELPFWIENTNEMRTTQRKIIKKEIGKGHSLCKNIKNSTIYCETILLLKNYAGRALFTYIIIWKRKILN